MTIRPAKATEWQLLQKLNDEVFADNQQYDSDIVENWAMSQAGTDYFQEVVSNPKKVCLVAQNTSGEIVGYLAASELVIDYRKSRYLEINNMGVSPSVRSQGVGQKLVAECIDWAEQHGFEKLIVNSYIANTKAVQFYKKNGFTEIDLSLELSVVNKNAVVPVIKKAKKRFHLIVAVHALFIHEGQVLLLERANTGYMDGCFSVPAGHVDGGESIWKAAQREIYEEVGVMIPDQQKPIHVMHRTKDSEERIDYFFVITSWPGELINAEPAKCAQINWFPLDELPKNIVPYIRFALEEVRHNQVFSEYNE